MRTLLMAAGLTAAGLSGGTASAVETLAIATVNNADMVIMQKLSPEFERAAGIKLKWVVLEENTLRQRVTTDIATKSGQFDIITIGSYEAPIWGRQGWLVELSDLGPDYDSADVLDSVKKSVSVDGKQYAAPFYAESSFLMYRKDLFEAAGIRMPGQPTYTQLAEYAGKLHSPDRGVHGLCMRGKPGWGENMAYFSTMVNVFGGRWFDMDWKPQLDSPQWKTALKFYVDVANKYGPPGVTSNGFNENLALFSTGHCAMWIDATVAAGRLLDPKHSQVVGKTAFAAAPVQETVRGGSWLWAWSLAIPVTSEHADAARKFVAWATSKQYIQRVGETEGWLAVPPGTRKSTYENPAYQAAAPFAGIVLKAIQEADPEHPSAQPVPYTGVQYVAIPEFQALATKVGQDVAAAVVGRMSVDQALKASQRTAERTLKRAAYRK